MTLTRFESPKTQVLNAAYDVLTLNTLTRSEIQEVMVALQRRLDSIPTAKIGG